MSTNEPRASELRQRVPDAFRLAFLLVFKPLELWASMVLWDVDGDPGLRFIWPLRGRHQRDWVFRLAEISGAAAVFASLVLLKEYKWSDMLGLIAIGLLVALVVAWVAGIAFATLLGVLVAGMMMVGVWLPSKIADVPATVALWCFGIGFAIQISWVISDQVFFDSKSDRYINEALHSGHRYHKVLRLYVLAVCAFACYLGGDTGPQRIALAGLLGLGISLHPLVERIRQVVQRRKPLVFLSYRRNDDASRVLVDKLRQILPRGSTFLDERMPSGEWQRNLLSALERATVLLAFVGPDWEKYEKEKEGEKGDMTQRRSSFWVSFELGYAERRDIPIRAVMIDHNGCPPYLSDFQFTRVSSKPEKEKEVLERLIDDLKRDGMRF